MSNSRHYPDRMSLLSCVLVFGIPLSLNAETEVTFVPHPPAEARNQHYAGNRDPLVSSPFVKLPIGAVVPRGWLRTQLELQSNGFHGHLGEISSFLNKENNAWLNPEGEGERGWEEVPYWLKGFGDCAYLLQKEDQIAEAKVWIEGAIKSQREDGFFGPRGKGATSTVDSTQGKYDLWPNMVMLHCLQSYYEYSGDQRVLDLMSKYFKWELTIADEDFLPPYWQHQRAADNLWSVVWLYNHTGDPQLLELADKIHRHTANWTDDIPDWHNVNMAQAFGGPAYFYPISKDQRHLDAAERNYQKFRDLYGQVPGGLFGGDEVCRAGFTDPRQAIETCGMVEFMYSCERLLSITGDIHWAERCEDVAYNSLPAALTADFKALRYLTAPNLIQSDRQSKAPGFFNGGAMLEMNPHSHRCCQHNFGHGWPYFAERLWMATSDNGLAAVFYSESEVKAHVADGTEVSIAEQTHYPFDEQISLTITAPEAVNFPLYLGIPSWCEKPQLKVNDELIMSSEEGKGYVRIARTWNSGDRVELLLPMPIRVNTWAKNKNSVSVERGPLTYSLKILEKYVPSGGTETWPAYEILPNSPWNYALLLEGANVSDAFEVIKNPWPESNMPFTHEGTPIELRCRARSVPQWKSDYLGLVGLLQASPVRSDSPIDQITLIPMGAARLRISAFPVLGSGADAHTWEIPPEAMPLKVSASHCWDGDTVRAIADKLLPINSNDHSLPRFTWWDHRGTKEWIVRELDAPRQVSSVKVYWFDDEPNKGACRTPASWQLLYRKNNEWVPVSRPTEYDSHIDGFCLTEFEPVETDALRIEVQLRDQFSAGILEWEIP